MKDLNTIIGKLSQSGLLSGLTGGLAGGAVVSALNTKSGRKLGKTVLQAGALAAVGGIAWKAYRAYSQRGQEPETGSVNGRGLGYLPSPHWLQDSSGSPAQQKHNGSSQLVILRAMIAAAYADGHIDALEKQRIFNEVERMDLSIAEKGVLFDELRHPSSIHTIVEQVNSMETAVQVYTASLLVIDENQPPSTFYLRSLASALRLPEALVNNLHSEVQSIKMGEVESVA